MPIEHSFKAYLPRDRLQALATGDVLPETAAGAVLSADISGFTPLTEALVDSLGLRRGTEELAYLLNRVYDVLIEQVDRYGGSVVAFGGDSILCWFGGEGDETPLRAVACALAMQGEMRQFGTVTPGMLGRGPSRLPDERDTVAVTLRTGVASGQVRRWRVGNPTIQVMEVLAGATVQRVVTAERLARHGEVLVDLATALALGGRWRCRGWRHDAAGGGRFAVVDALRRPPPPAPWPLLERTPEAWRLRPWVQPAVYRRLRDGLGEFLTELRSAVALFLGFGGIDYDGDSRAGERLDAYIRWVQQVLGRYQGTLVQFTIDAKGSYLYAAFGSPIAHTDDARRAVAAALELLTPPSDPTPIRAVRIGISQGVMRTGSYGGAKRRAFGVLGAEVNLAARLMQHAAPGQVLASGRTRRAAGDGFVWESLPALRVKGRAEPVPVHRLVGKAAGSVRRRGGMVGRRREWGCLARDLKALLDGQGRAVLVEGEAGIGKSLLVERLARLARKCGVRTLRVVGEADERFAPYHAWRPVFQELLDLRVSRRPPGELLDIWAPELAPLAPLLGVVLALDLPDNELTSQMNGEVRADNTRRLLLRLLQVAARQPLLLVLEDVHWLDSASWFLVQWVSREVRSVLLVATRRPELVPPGRGAASEAQVWPDTQVMRLGPLSGVEIEILACRRLGVDELPAKAAEFIRRKAGGSPFFAEELVYGLRDAGLIVVRQGGCALAPGVSTLETVGFPDTIEGVILSRIDRLPPARQLILKTASVIGRSFDYAILEGSLGPEADREPLREHLEHLQRLGLLQRVPGAPGPAFLFRHEITRDVVYNVTAFVQRRYLHRQVALWYEQRHAADLAPYYPLLAHHWGCAEVTAKALDYLEKAGHKALREYANEEAVRFFTEAVERARGDPGSGHIGLLRRAGWYAGLGRAYRNHGSLADSRTHLHRALGLLGERPPAGRLRLPLRVLGQLLIQAGLRLGVGGLGAYRQRRREELLAKGRIYATLTDIYYYNNDGMATLYAALRSLNLIERAGGGPEQDPNPGLAEAYSATGLCMMVVRGPARYYCRKAETVARRSGRLAIEIRVIITNSLYYLGSGQWDNAHRAMERARGLCIQLGDWRQWNELTAGLGLNARFQGHYRYSRDCFADLLDQARRRHNDLHTIWALSERALLDLRTGDLQRAVDALEDILVMLARAPNASAEIFAYGLLALGRLRLGEWPAAAAAADQAARRCIHSVPIVLHNLDSYAAVVEVNLALWRQAGTSGERRERSRAARRACRYLARYAWQFKIGRPRARLWQGCLEWQAGRSQKARRAFEKSLAAARRLDMPYDEGLAHAMLGRGLPAADPMRRWHLEWAESLLAALGVGWRLARVRADLKGDGGEPN